MLLALGAWRIVHSRVLTRRVPAVETLGSATVLCVDKTGTLTLKRMTVKALAAGEAFCQVTESGGPLAERSRELVEHAALTSEIEPHDPMEQAVHALAERLLGPRRAWHARCRLEREYALSLQLLAPVHVRDPCGGGNAWSRPRARPRRWRGSRGSPRTHGARSRRKSGAGRARACGCPGSRALERGRAAPPQPAAFGFEWLGLVGLADPVRPTVEGTLRERPRAGTRVVMITGDYPVTVQAIARAIRLEPAEQVLTGAELEAMDVRELRERVHSINIYARVVPEQELRLVQALEASGEVVAMTGDGVNDAPAPKAAHIGIAMGGRGTDVAREAAALVLLEDDFDSSVDAVRFGWRIDQNLRNAISCLLAVHVPAAGMAPLPLVFGWPMAFFFRCTWCSSSS